MSKCPNKLKSKSTRQLKLKSKRQLTGYDLYMNEYKESKDREGFRLFCRNVEVRRHALQIQELYRIGNRLTKEGVWVGGVDGFRFIWDSMGQVGRDVWIARAGL